MKPMTRHLPGDITDAIDDLTSIHITLAGIQDIPAQAIRNSARHIALAMLGAVIARLTRSLEMVE
ncbi:MAG: hypothetical protein IT490_11585 [Candidatus Contendobacter sp.]|nr:hypothetical protein [Candidatus Contendobacter sp.]